MIRSLVLTYKPAFPPFGGAPLRNWQNINGLLRLGPVAAVSLIRGVLPAAGAKLGLQLHSAVVPRSLGIVKSVLPRPLPGISRANNWLIWKSFRSQLDHLRSEFRPDVVVFAELAWLRSLRIMDLVRGWSIPVVYDAHNVEVDRLNELANAPAQSEIVMRRAIRAFEAESAITSAAAQIWTCSESDRQRMAEKYGVGEKAITIQNGVDLEYYLTDAPIPIGSGLSCSSYKVLYTGDFSYTPNEIAVDRMCSQLLPELRRRLGRVRLYLVGINPTKSMLDRAAGDLDIIVTGRVPDIRPYLKNCDCMLIPLDFGGGTRLKILEAFAAGCPVVSTPKGAEGLMVASGTHLMTARTNLELVDRTAEVCSRRDMAASLIENARRLIALNYDWSVIHARIAEAVLPLACGKPGWA